MTARHRSPAPPPQQWPMSAIAIGCSAGALAVLAATVAVGTSVAPEAQAAPRVPPVSVAEPTLPRSAGPLRSIFTTVVTTATTPRAEVIPTPSAPPRASQGVSVVPAEVPEAPRPAESPAMTTPAETTTPVPAPTTTAAGTTTPAPTTSSPATSTTPTPTTTPVTTEPTETVIPTELPISEMETTDEQP